MSDCDLGKLVKVELGDIWPNGSSHVTPWLAREANLLTLGETLGLELELEAQERAVGPFRADMAHGGPLARQRNPQPQSWMSYSTGRSGFGINASMSRPKRQVRAELSFSNPHAKTYLHLLHAQRAATEQELGYPLDWEELPEDKDTRISTPLNAIDREDQADWPRQHDWLAARLSDLPRVREPREDLERSVMAAGRRELSQTASS